MTLYILANMSKLNNDPDTDDVDTATRELYCRAFYDLQILIERKYKIIELYQDINDIDTKYFMLKTEITNDYIEIRQDIGIELSNLKKSFVEQKMTLDYTKIVNANEIIKKIREMQKITPNASKLAEMSKLEKDRALIEQKIIAGEKETSALQEHMIKMYGPIILKGLKI